MTFRRPLTVTRYGEGEWVDGMWQEGEPETLIIRASVQPTSPDDMEMLPEGRRDRQAFTLYSDDPFRTADDNEGTNADRVEIDGVTYEVSARAPWQNSIIPHHRSVVTKVAEQ